MNQLKRLSRITQSNNHETKKFRVSTEGEKSVRCIENFSNELFYELFDYLDGCDIFNAFSNLNKRFENLLNNLSLLIKIKLSSQTLLPTYCKTIIIPNKHRIFSLNFSDESILDRFILQCNINSSFQQLQSIILNSLPAYKFVALLFDLISLPRLYSLTCNLTSCFLDVSYIYRIIFRFQSLQYFYLSLPIIEDLEDFEQAIFVADQQQLSNIQYLTLDHCCTLNDFISIILCTPRLHHLTCQTLFQSDEDLGKEFLFSSTNLTHIFLNKCELKFDIFEILMKKISSQLQVFHIIIRSNDEMYIDADRWERLIIEYMPCLRKFYLKYYQCFNEHLKLTPIHRFSSTFWIERKWMLGLELDENDLIYSIHPHKKMWYEWHDHREKNPCTYCQITLPNVTYRCSSIRAEAFSEYYSSIFTIMKITYLDIDCSRVPLLACIKLIRLLSELNSLKISSLSLADIKRLCVEKSKIIQAVAYNNKITKLYVDKISDLGELQFLITLCPSMEYFETSFTDEITVELFLSFILTKQINNYLTHLSTLCIHVQNGNDQMIGDLYKIIEFKKQCFSYTIKRIENQIYLHWNTQSSQNAHLNGVIC